MKEKSKTVKELEKIGKDALQHLKEGKVTPEESAKIESLVKRLIVEINRKENKK